MAFSQSYDSFGLFAIEAAVIPGWTMRDRTARTHMLAEVFRQISDYLYLSAWNSLIDSVVVVL